MFSVKGFWTIVSGLRLPMTFTAHLHVHYCTTFSVVLWWFDGRAMLSNDYKHKYVQPTRSL